MTLHSLLLTVSPSDVFAALKTAYPDTSVKNMLGYQEVLYTLRSLEPTPNTTRIAINWIVPDPRYSDPDETGYWDVSGRNEEFAKTEGFDETQMLALDFTAWAEWLGMEVEPDAFGKLSIAEIIAHCLWEMTFCGYSEKERDGEWEIIKQRYDEAVVEFGVEGVCV